MNFDRSETTTGGSAVLAPVWERCAGGCGARVTQGGYCPLCQETNARLDGIYGEWKAASDRRAAAELRRAKHRRTWLRVADILCFVLFWALLLYIAIGLAPWFIALWQMWFGGAR